MLQKFNVKSLVSSKKQGFSVNTINLWNSYGKRTFLHFFDRSRLIEDKIISDACESLIGAIYLDQGFSAAEKFILKFWKNHMKKNIEGMLNIIDFSKKKKLKR